MLDTLISLFICIYMLYFVDKPIYFELYAGSLLAFSFEYISDRSFIEYLYAANFGISKNGFFLLVLGNNLRMVHCIKRL